MGKAMTVTDTKTLWGEDPDKRNPSSTSICMNDSHFRVQSYLRLQFLHFFCLDNKNNTRGGGGGGALSYIETFTGHAIFRVSVFSINS